MQKTVEDIIRESVRSILRDIIVEKKRRGKKPGGGLTRWGAERKIRKNVFRGKVGDAISVASGDVDSAAKRLGVAPRTLYGYIQDEPSLQKKKEDFEEEDEE